MKNHGYSKDVMNSVKNILIIPTMLLTWVLKKITSKYKAHYLEVYMRARFIFLLQVISCFMIFMLDITEFYAATGAMLWMGLISSTQFFMDCIIVNTISDSLFAGMYVTMMASSANLGRNGTINLKVIDYVGFDYACYFGFFYCIFSLAVFGKGVEWIKNGK